MKNAKKQQMNSCNFAPRLVTAAFSDEHRGVPLLMISNCLRGTQAHPIIKWTCFRRTLMDLIVSRIDKIQSASNDEHVATNEEPVRYPFLVCIRQCR